jgi:hypothetical protein
MNQSIELGTEKIKLRPKQDDPIIKSVTLGHSGVQHQKTTVAKNGNDN